MKRIIALLLALICALCFSGCGAGKGKGGDEGELSGALEDNPASSVVMTPSQAETLAGTVGVKLYYKTADGDSIIAETALMDFNRRDKKVSSLAADILAKLLDGPSNVTMLANIIPEGTKIYDVSLRSGTLLIDVNKAFVDGIDNDANTAKLVVYSVVNTVTEVKDVDRVEFTCDGEKIGALSCGFEFKTFERDLSLVKSDAETGVGVDDPYAEELYEDVVLE